MRYLLIILSLFSFSFSQSNNYWISINDNQYIKNNQLIKILNEDYLLDLIEQVPLISSNKKSEITLEFPTPNNDLIQFEIYESPVMPINLSKKYPSIKTYTGRGIKNPNDRVSITKSNRGFQILILTNNERIFIQKINQSENNYSISYNENINDRLNIENQCSINGCSDVIIRNESDNIETENRNFPNCVGESDPCYPIGNNLVTFRYAGILTAEANNEVADGTVEGGLAWIAAMVNQVNLVWIRELSFRLQLIENNDQIIYTNENPTPDLFTAYDMYVELPLVQQHLTDVIGPGGWGVDQNDLLWEYGAVFNVGYGGGLAYVPGSTSANSPSYAVHIHEVGHNIGSGHNCTSEGGWGCSFGGTAMCNRDNTLLGSYGDQYSSHTIDIAIKYQQEMFSNNNYDYQRGWLQLPTSNSIPEIIVPESGFTIPKETPFVLEGIASDLNANDQITYSWEQNDASSIAFSPPDFPPRTGPLFCSVDAKSNGNKRYFPQLESVLQNDYSTGNIEKLPFATREINMRLIARDNNLFSGAFNYKNVQFFVDENSGPFRITSQLSEEVWDVGSQQNITWDVANTNNPNTVNCQSVDILLSIDGTNFDIVLAENTPNDGSEYIIVPNLPSDDNYRIMIKSSDNIFFDVNNSYLTIISSNIPVIDIDTSDIVLSLQDNVIFDFEREIENSGEEGSILIYNPITDINLPGDGYLFFDGQWDYVDLGHNLLSGDGDFSISLWVKSPNASNRVIMQQRNGGFNGEYQIKFDSYGRIEFWSYRDGYKWRVLSPNSYIDNEWHHIVIVQDALINGGRLYIDGIEVDSNSEGVVYLDGAITTYLGADMRHYADYLYGRINDVNIFNFALPESDINILFNSGFGFNTTYNHGGYNSADYIVASYPMQAMSGTTLFDVTGNGFDGTIHGPEWEGDLSAVPNWLDIISESSWLESGETESIILRINSSELIADNNYQGKLIIPSNADSIPVEILIDLDIVDDAQMGDINMDGNINVLDVILLLELVLYGEYSGLADLNADGVLNVLDVIAVVNIILAN